MTERIVFICQHGAAKSIMAAAYCRALAEKHNLNIEILAAGADPDAQIFPEVIELLRAEKLALVEQHPRQATPADLANASQVISMGCDLKKISPSTSSTNIEDWSDVPPPSKDLRLSFDRIRLRVQELIAHLQKTKTSAAHEKRLDGNNK
jgi:protein-tyrosine-phosphatase